MSSTYTFEAIHAMEAEISAKLNEQRQECVKLLRELQQGQSEYDASVQRINDHLAAIEQMELCLPPGSDDWATVNEGEAIDRPDDKTQAPNECRFRSAAALRDDVEFMQTFRVPQDRMQEDNVKELINNFRFACLEGTELFGFLCYLAGLSGRNVAVVSPHFFAAHGHDLQTGKESIRSHDCLFGDEEACDVVLVPMFIYSGQDFENDIGHWIVGIYEKTEETLRIFDSGHSYPSQRTVDLLTAAITTLRPDLPGIAAYNVKCVMQPFSLYNRQFDGTSCGFFAALYAELYLLYGREGTFIEYFDIDRHRRRIVRLISALQRGQIPEHKKPQASMGLQAHIVYDGQLEFPLGELIAKADTSNVVLESSVVRGRTLSGRILVRNLAYDKAVFVRSTCNGWKNYLDWDAVYESSPAEGYDMFRFEAALPGTAEMVEFCAGYVVHGVEYWDSNGGKNYGVQLPRRAASQKQKGDYMHVARQAEALFNRFKSLIVGSSPTELDTSPTSECSLASSAKSANHSDSEPSGIHPPRHSPIRQEATGSLEVTVRIMQQGFEVESTEVKLPVDFAQESSADLARKVAGVLGDREGVSFEKILVFDSNTGEYVEPEECNAIVEDGKYVVLLSFDPTALQDDSHLLTECVVCGDQLLRTEGIACQHADNEVLSVEYHMFCAECTRKYVQHSIHEMPLAPNRDGMKCMEPACQRSICSATLRGILPADIVSLLDDRCMAENLAMLSGFERCKTAGCYYAVEIERHPSIEPAFRCPLCGANFCRLCQRDMHPLHEGVTCEELDRREEEARQRDELDAANRPVYDEMSAAVIRVCPRCSMHFVKSAGCNFMTCRCGMTMCYICKTPDINGNHFGASCQQTEDAAVHDDAVLATLESKLRT